MPREKKPTPVEMKVRLDPDLHARLATEAETRAVSQNLLVGRAVEAYLEALHPAEAVAPRIDLSPSRGIETRPKKPTRTTPRLR